jgi:hypothetical protein
LARLEVAKCPKIKWPDELAEAIVWKGPVSRRLVPMIAQPEVDAEGQARNEKAFDEQNLDVLDQALDKLEVLKDHFNIPRGVKGDRLLALKLAMIFVPGFRLKNRRRGPGRPRDTWTDGARIGLLIDIEWIKENEKIRSDSAALVALLKAFPQYAAGKQLRTSGTLKRAAESLGARLTEARKRVKALGLTAIITLPITRLAFAPDSPVRARLRGVNFD